MKIDCWPWGCEKIVWGFELSHKYTLKILEPKAGRAGCLSLQKHAEKSETWLVMRGSVWALAVAGGQVCTKILRPFDFLNLPAGTIHRLTALEEGVQVLEASTPDVHAADKSRPKDVVRLHCVHGRAVSPAANADEARIVEFCVQLTEKALWDLENGMLPAEENAGELKPLLGVAALSGVEE